MISHGSAREGGGESGGEGARGRRRERGRASEREAGRVLALSGFLSIVSHDQNLQQSPGEKGVIIVRFCG